MRSTLLVLSLFFLALCLPQAVFAEESCRCNASSPGQCPEEDDDDDPYNPYEKNQSGSLSRNVVAPLTPIDLGQSNYLSIADVVDPTELPDGALQVVLFESSEDIAQDDRFKILGFYFSHGPSYAATFIPVPFEGSYDPDNPDADEFGYVYELGSMLQIFLRLLEYPGQGGGMDSINWTNFQNAEVILNLSADALSNLIQQRFRQQDEQRAAQGDTTTRFSDFYGAKQIAKLLAADNEFSQSIPYRVSDKFWDWFDDTIKWCLGKKKKKKKKEDNDEDDGSVFDDDDDDNIPMLCPGDTLPYGYDEVITGANGLRYGVFTDGSGKKKMCLIPSSLPPQYRP